jgi:hypothetical protein
MQKRLIFATLTPVSRVNNSILYGTIIQALSKGLAVARHNWITDTAKAHAAAVSA